MNQLQAHQLAAALSTATTVFAPPTSPQGRLAASLLQSAQSGIINENQKKAKKDAEKKKKKGALGEIGGLVGSIAGGAIGGPAGAAIGGALGGAAGSGSFDPTQALGYGTQGYMGAKSLTDNALTSAFQPSVDQTQAAQVKTAMSPAATMASMMPGNFFEQPSSISQKPQQFQTLIKSQAPELMQQPPQPQGFFKRIGNNIRGQVQMRTNPTRFMLNQATDGIYDLTPMGAY